MFAYFLLFVDPPMAALVAWLIGMTTRQAGHFFFEPKGYDHVNQATHEYKEEVKVGYNLQRKVVLMGIWALFPAVLLLEPTLFGLLSPHSDWLGYTRNLGMIWLVLGVAGVIFRMVQLFFMKDLQAALVWATKILTDPFHDIKLYYKVADLPAEGRADRSDHRHGACALTCPGRGSAGSDVGAAVAIAGCCWGKPLHDRRSSGARRQVSGSDGTGSRRGPGA